MTFLRWYSRLPDVPEVTEEGLSVIVPEVPCFTFSATVVTKERIINGSVRGDGEDGVYCTSGQLL